VGQHNFRLVGSLPINTLVLAHGENSITFPMGSRRPTTARNVYCESPRTGRLHALQLLDKGLALAHRDHNWVHHELVGSLPINTLVLAGGENSLTFPMGSCRPTTARNVYFESPRTGRLHALQMSDNRLALAHRDHNRLQHENVVWASIIFG
jgi:hypothetical protein